MGRKLNKKKMSAKAKKRFDPLTIKHDCAFSDYYEISTLYNIISNIACLKNLYLSSFKF